MVLWAMSKQMESPWAIGLSRSEDFLGNITNSVWNPLQAIGLDGPENLCKMLKLYLRPSEKTKVYTKSLQE
jgi:hypothetical protein